MDSLRLIDGIRHTPALKDVPLAQLGRLVECGQLLEFAPGDRLLEEGAAADAIYLLLEGGVRVCKRQGALEIDLAHRQAPDWLGEMALFDSAERVASVVAESEVRALAISRDAFLAVVMDEPGALLHVLRVVASRLRESDSQLIEALAERVRALTSANDRLSNENQRLRTVFVEQYGFESFVGESSLIRRARAAARQAAESDLPVLIVGETGTGKEVLARAIHAGSSRAQRPFVALNCAHLTESLLESELFGHARGAFTGASHVKRGLVEEADGGTLFLDEAADMPYSLQGALLRFLELGEFRRLGETEIRHAHVGLIAATQRDLDALAGAGAFRLDLLYRLDVMRVSLPALRERLQDLPLLIEHCSERIARRLGVAQLRMSPATLNALAAHDFPGNVRELENELERLYVIQQPGSVVQPDALSSRLAGARAASSGTYYEAVKNFKIQMIEKALRKAGGNRTHAARRLGVHRSNLVRTMKGLGMKGVDEASA